MRRFGRLSGGPGDTRISVQSARGLNEGSVAFGTRLKNFREIFHRSNYLNGRINFGVGA